MDSLQKKENKNVFDLLIKLLPLLFIIIAYFWFKQDKIVDEINDNYEVSKIRFYEKVEIRGNRYSFYYKYLYKENMYIGSINMNASPIESENFMKKEFILKISRKNPKNSIVIIDNAIQINSGVLVNVSN